MSNRVLAVATSQRVQAATTRAVTACRRVENLADNILDEIEDYTPVQGVPLMDLDDEDSAVVAVKEVLSSAPGSQSAAGPTAAPKRRARTEPGVR